MRGRIRISDLGCRMGFMHCRSVAAIGVALLNGCDAVAPSRAVDGAWRLENAERSGAALVYTDGDGLSSEIRCREAPPDVMLFVNAQRIPRDPDGRLNLRVAGRTFTWPMDRRHDGAGAYAYGLNEPAFRKVIRSGGELDVEIGDHRLHFSRLNPVLARRFALACEAFDPDPN